MSLKTKLGICWLQPDQWDQAKALFTDSDAFGENYDAWRKTTTDAIHKLQTVGATAVKVKIDLDEFEQWCTDKQLPVDVKSCSQFVKTVMERNQ